MLMSFTIGLTFDAIEIRLSGWDAVRLVRQRLAMPYQLVAGISVMERHAAELDVNHSAAAQSYPRRVGATDRTEAGGHQFWAVGPSAGSAEVVVVDTRHDRFTRLVLEPAQMDAFVEALRAQVSRD